MFKKIKEQGATLEDFFYLRHIEYGITFFLLIASIKLPFLLIVVLFMIIQMIISMIITYHKAGTYYYHRKTGQKIQARRFRLLIFVSGGYPQMWDGHQVGRISDEYLIWNLKSKPPKQGLLVDDLPKDITDHNTIYDKIERREGKGEEILEYLYMRDIEIAILVVVLSLTYFIFPLIILVLPYFIWLVMSIFFPPMKRGEVYYHKRSGREVTVVKPYWIFSICEFPQIRHDCEVGAIDDFYLNWNLKKLPEKKSRIDDEGKFE